MDGDRRAPAAAAAASAAGVLGSDDLLPEIFLRLAFPHYLVRAALVSKRWLLHAFDPAFLRRFRDRHLPRLLGFCAGNSLRPYDYVPLPQPPELAALSRRATSSCNEAFAARKGQWIKHCRNGRLLIETSDEGRNECVLLTPLLSGRKFRAEVLGSGVWGVPTTAAIEVEPLYPEPRFRKLLPPVHGKIFAVTSFGHAVGLDLTTQRFFILDLPDGVGESSFLLSCAANSGLFLVSAEEFRISVWLHRMTADGDGAGCWLLVDTFCVREACARLDSRVPQDGGFVHVVAVGDYADFVFLEHAGSGAVFYVHLRTKVVQKVYRRVPAGRYGDGINIFPMMIWPPIFPGHDQQE